MSKSDIIGVIQDAIDTYKKLDERWLTTAEWAEVQMGFEDMAELFTKEQEHE